MNKGIRYLDQVACEKLGVPNLVINAVISMGQIHMQSTFR